ncbi:hypothetical protein DFH08DRAFT_962946 [Mycena albidolilacea]|uniref:Uncharacterized protein n=1 Tax=Mycena albidolilacea TaxID=1033008 RepID=A0AAD7EP97_9AGAR|nr:hypothetical protein DFH08DRAFT_962946 [Mycena albidolilacea]
MEGGSELLKKGFAALQKHVNKRKATLQDRLKKEERINDDDSTWLDGPANLIDEERTLELLDSASDYEQGLSCLNNVLQAAVNHMKEFAAGVTSSVSALKAPSTKRKKEKTRPITEFKNQAPISTGTAAWATV